MTDLLARAGEKLGARHTTYVVARVGPSGVETDARGTDVHGDVELGSVSKGVTGLLWRDSIARGEVEEDATLGDHLEISGPVGRLTLSSLATHRSGLPRLAGGSDMLRRSWELWRQGRNPYREDLPALLAMLDEVKLRRPGRPSYSNLGFQLLGHAVAAAAGGSYVDLLRTRIAEPLAMLDSYVPTAVDQLRPTAVTPRNRRGTEVEPWANEAIAPAGGVRSSSADLAVLLRAMLDGTGGFRSFVGIDRHRGTGIALVSASTRSVDGAASTLLFEAEAA